MKKRLSSAWNYYSAWVILSIFSFFAINDSMNSWVSLLIILADIFFCIILLKIYVIQFDDNVLYVNNIYRSYEIPLNKIILIDYNPMLINRGFQIHYGYTLTYTNFEKKNEKIWFFVPQSRLAILDDLKKRILSLNPDAEFKLS